MLVRIEAPSPIEVQSVAVDERGLEIQPLPVRGQHLLRVAYLAATGANGGESKAILYFNGNTGDFVVSAVSPGGKQLAFDALKPDDFDQQRRQAIARKQQAAEKPDATDADKLTSATGVADA